MTKLVVAIDLRRNQPDAADQIRRIVAADPHRGARIEFQHLGSRHLRVKLDQPGLPDVIETRRGYGYLIAADS